MGVRGEGLGEGERREGGSNPTQLGQYDSINPLARRVPKYSHGPTPLARGASNCSHVVNICLQKAGDTPCSL